METDIYRHENRSRVNFLINMPTLIITKNRFNVNNNMKQDLDKDRVRDKDIYIYIYICQKGTNTDFEIITDIATESVKTFIEHVLFLVCSMEFL